jgi:O-antigen/teichoic acid export membrane protein
VAKNILQFGGWIILSTGTYFLSSRGEVLILKGSVPDILFGCFAFASMLVQAPLTAITQLGSQVMLPFLATWIRAGEAKAQQQFRRTKWLFTGFGICFSWGAILVSPWLVKLLHLNRSYANVEWMVQCLGVRAAFDVFVLPTSNSLLAAGVSRFSAVGNVVRLAVLVSGLFLTVKVFSLGMTGAMWILVGAPPIAYLALLPGLATAVRNVIATEIVAFALFCTATAAAFGLYLTTRPLFG